VRRTFLLVAGLVLLTLPASAQRRGAIEAGGFLALHSFSAADRANQAQISMDGLLGYYMNRDLGFDIEPSLNLLVNPDSVGVTLMLLGSLRIRLFDMGPAGVRKSDLLRTDYGITSSCLANVGVGYWSDGFSFTEKPATHTGGPAIMVGIGTQSLFGRFSTIRVRCQWIEMLTRGDSKGRGGSMLLVGVGFGVFLRS
jgi:hypothetical protein